MNRVSSIISSCIVAALVLTGTSTCALAETFVFTAIPDQDETRLRDRYDKVATYLSKHLAVVQVM